MKNEEIIAKLSALRAASQTLDISETERVALLQSISDYINTFLSNLKETPSFSQREPKSLAIDGQKRTLAELLQFYQKEVAETGINASSGKHMGYIPGGGIFISALADLIAAATNPYAGVYYASPGAVTIENEVVNWLKKTFGFPENAVGNLTSGGSISTLIALTAARDKYKVKNDAVQKSVVYLSEQVHHSTQKALRIIGLEDVIIRQVPLDDHHRLKPDVLTALIKTDFSQGLRPFLIIATAGTTDTGAIDPLDELAEIAHKYDLWLHVDGAYGGFFILTSKKEQFKGIEKADSIIVDPHKSLFIPYGVGAVLIKDAQAALHSNYYEANYMQDSAHEEIVKSPANLSPELTKHFRGLRIWLPLQMMGIEPFTACLEEKLYLIQYFRIKLAERGFELGPEPDLSISYFWYPFKEESDKKNRQLMDEIHADGEVFLSSTIVQNRFVIRMAVLAFRTKKETVDKAVAMIDRCLKKVKD